MKSALNLLATFADALDTIRSFAPFRTLLNALANLRLNTPIIWYL
jgi:hypothetical protein